MSIRRESRQGVPLEILGRQIAFTFWPVKKYLHRYGLQSRLFASNPWAVIRRSIRQQCLATSLPQALAFCEQAEDYFNAATMSGIVAAKPVLLYYCFLNLAKAYVLTIGQRDMYSDKAFHGLKEVMSPGGKELINASLQAFLTATSNANIFDDFLKSVRGSGLGSQMNFPIVQLLPQILQGHRLWCDATKNTERFIEIGRIDILHNKSFKSMWLALMFFEDDLSRLHVTSKRLLSQSLLKAEYNDVKCDELVNSRKLIKFEQINPLQYNHRPSDKISDLMSTLRHKILTNVLSVPPYRKYYIYVSPNAEHPHVLPQLLSIYATFYYLSSVTRYRPHRFGNLVTGNFGAQIEEIISNLPNQFLYLMASQFAQQEVTRAAIV